MCQQIGTQPAKAPIVLRDARGGITSTFTPKGNTYVIRDRQGRLTGSVTLKGNTVTKKDNQGRIKNDGRKIK